MELNRDQFELISAFFVWVWVANWKGGTLDHTYWAKQLDDAGISWRIQNLVACRASEDRSSNFIYFRTVCSQLEIEVNA